MRNFWKKLNRGQEAAGQGASSTNPNDQHLASISSNIQHEGLPGYTSHNPNHATRNRDHHHQVEPSAPSVEQHLQPIVLANAVNRLTTAAIVEDQSSFLLSPPLTQQKGKEEKKGTVRHQRPLGASNSRKNSDKAESKDGHHVVGYSTSGKWLLYF